MKFVLIVLAFLHGEGQGQFQPAPGFDTLGECAAFYDKYKEQLEQEGMTTRALCVSDNEVKVLQ